MENSQRCGPRDGCEDSLDLLLYWMCYMVWTRPGRVIGGAMEVGGWVHGDDAHGGWWVGPGTGRQSYREPQSM